MPLHTLALLPSATGFLFLVRIPKFRNGAGSILPNFNIIELELVKSISQNYIRGAGKVRVFARRSPSKLGEAFARTIPPPIRNFGIFTKYHTSGEGSSEKENAQIITGEIVPSKTTAGVLGIRT
jgi:hypothetical protein